eukprot:CAMPEP_0197036072 /NCGR_PEP_ID=MMETSP1384-20130603/13685_1 /TAXON_ID=29189 /ORGANISM="Ammonia sp." /LENGTH=356 /DNA_ID=CAMNT_0042466205 /DNA_START=14 /DNA_END=1080 /DNA_ORIENTATION=+
MTLQNESAIANAGAVVVAGFGILVEIMIGIVVVVALCTQRYDKDETLNISFANDMRRLSTAKITDFQFSRKLIRYARYSVLFQWLSYLICLILIMVHEFLTEPVLIDHCIYITFLINLSCLFLSFRNVGIYYFMPFSDDKNFPNPLHQQELEEQKAEFDEIDDGQQETKEERDDLELADDEEPEQDADDNVGIGHNHGMAGRRFSHHHYEDPDLMPDPDKMVKQSGNVDWDLYNRSRLKIRIEMVHLFRSIAYTSMIYWVGYVIAVVHDKNDVLLATLALADILLGILVAGHLFYCRKLSQLLNKYSSMFGGYDDEYDTRREDRVFQLDRWVRADIGIIGVLAVKCVVMLVRISTT